MYALTKSRITTGLKCEKRLWFDVNDAIHKDTHLFYLGNRFGDFAKKFYGEAFDLSGNLNAIDAIEKTQQALLDPSVTIIYEAAFLFESTLVRTDVLIRRTNGWDMVEVKSSSNVQDNHVIDAAVQAYIARANGLKINKIIIAHINKEFFYSEKNDYNGLLIEVDVTDAVNLKVENVKPWINSLLPVASKGSEAPEVVIGDQCGSGPNTCPYISRCSASLELPEVPISILPNIGKRLSKEWSPRGIHDLRELPAEALSNFTHKKIQQAHIEGKDWVSEELVEQINNFKWPRFFMDFETTIQGVPLVKGTRPKERLAFQWSIHRWDGPDQELKLEDGNSFLEFTGDELEKRFLLDLIDALGTDGPIFAHNAVFETGLLAELSKRGSCADLKPEIDAIIARVVCTLKLARSGFYSTQMRGSYSLKDIVKAVPNCLNYEGEKTDNGAEVTNGDEAMIAWFKCTDNNLSESEKNIIKTNLKKYCAQDTLNLYHFFQYIINYDK